MRDIELDGGILKVGLDDTQRVVFMLPAPNTIPVADVGARFDAALATARHGAHFLGDVSAR